RKADVDGRLDSERRGHRRLQDRDQLQRRVRHHAQRDGLSGVAHMAVKPGGTALDKADLTSKEMVREVSIVATAFDVGRMELVLAPVKEGSTTKTLAVTLRKNALVRAFDVVITAASATEVAAGVAGQIRTTSKD